MPVATPPAHAPESARLFKAYELGKLLRVGRSTIYRWAEEGLIPSVRIGRTVRFDLADVQRALKRHTD